MIGRSPWSFGVPLQGWKLVDLEHADRVAAGALKIGRLIDYHHLENGRADAMEGWMRLTDDGLDANRPADLKAYEAGGVVIIPPAGANPADCDFRITNNVFGRKAPDTYCLCMSKVGCTYDPEPEKPKARFLVKDVDALGNRLMDILTDRIERNGRYGPVVYSKRVFHLLQANDPAAIADPFLKDEKFAEEDEIRLVFSPVWDTPFTTIFTDPDPVVAALVERVD